MQELKSGFKRIVNWKKQQSKVKIQASKPYLDLLIDLSLLFVLLFENKDGRTVNTKHYLATAEVKGFNMMMML